MENTDDKLKKMKPENIHVFNIGTYEVTLENPDHYGFAAFTLKPDPNTKSNYEYNGLESNYLYIVKAKPQDTPQFRELFEKLNKEEKEYMNWLGGTIRADEEYREYGRDYGYTKPEEIPEPEKTDTQEKLKKYLAECLVDYAKGKKNSGIEKIDSIYVPFLKRHYDGHKNKPMFQKFLKAFLTGDKALMEKLYNNVPRRINRKNVSEVDFFTFHGKSIQLSDDNKSVQVGLNTSKYGEDFNNTDIPNGIVFKSGNFFSFAYTVSAWSVNEIYNEQGLQIKAGSGLFRDDREEEKILSFSGRIKGNKDQNGYYPIDSNKKIRDPGYPDEKILPRFMKLDNVQMVDIEDPKYIAHNPSEKEMADKLKKYREERDPGYKPKKTEIEFPKDYAAGKKINTISESLIDDHSTRD